MLQRFMALVPRVRFGGFFVRSQTASPPRKGATASIPGFVPRAERHLILIRGRERRLVSRPLAWELPETQSSATDPTSWNQQGVLSFQESLLESDIVFMDELSRLGSVVPSFPGQIQKAFEGPVCVVATSRTPAEDWVLALGERDDTEAIFVDSSNRVGLENRLADRLLSKT